MIRPMRNIGKALLKWVVLPYVTLYVTLSGSIAYDYNKNYSARVEQNPVETLQVHRYRAEVKGNEKYFTLVWEEHVYTIRDNAIGNSLVNSHDSFASESGDSGCANISVFTKLESRAVNLAEAPSRFFYQLGTGRRFDSISRVARKKGYKVHSLEGCSSENIPFGPQASRIINGIKGAAFGPLLYYVLREEGEPAKPTCEDSALNEVRPRRDKLQAEGLVNLLEQDEINNLLVNIGACHQQGVMTNLEAQLHLEEVK